MMNSALFSLRNKIFFIIVLIYLSVSRVSCLECYVCEDQEDNHGKCKSTVVVCAQGEDRCLSSIAWGSPPYWEIGAPMQYYISKMCATVEQCEAAHNETIGLCDRIEWRDWRCAECCQGDRCNYYITLGSSSVKASLVVLIISGIIALLFSNS